MSKVRGGQQHQGGGGKSFKSQNRHGNGGKVQKQKNGRGRKQSK